MASLRIMFVTLAILGIYTSNSWATDYIVGDDYAWTLGFDYQEWAKDKVFWVGDRLIFNYPVSAHNVLKVDKDSFQACVVPKDAEVLETGHDMIELKTPGTKMYICGIGQHCNGGMKLSINVWSQIESPAPTPTSGDWY